MLNRIGVVVELRRLHQANPGVVKQSQGAQEDRLLRRKVGVSGDASAFRFGDVEIDLAKRQVRKRNALVHLTALEYRLLTTMVASAEKVLTHRQILREVWGPAYVEHEHYVRVHMGHLRRKLEDDPAQPKHLLTETAVGYRLVP